MNLYNTLLNTFIINESLVKVAYIFKTAEKTESLIFFSVVYEQDSQEVVFLFNKFWNWFHISGMWKELGDIKIMSSRILLRKGGGGSAPFLSIATYFFRKKIEFWRSWLSPFRDHVIKFIIGLLFIFLTLKKRTFVVKGRLSMH